MVRFGIVAMIGSACLVAGCTNDGGYAGSQVSSASRSYDYDRPDPAYGGYDAGRYYREDSRRRERKLSQNDRVYRGQDGQYYCRNRDGTTGLIVGALAGGVLGNIIAPGGSETVGTILGAGGGALLGRSIDRNKARCR